MIQLSGIFPPIPTPFHADGSLDLTALEENACWWRTVGFSGVVVLGSNGEYVALREREKLAMIQRTRELFPPDQLVIAGTGAESTVETIDLCRAAATYGADAVIVVTPHYYRSRMDAAALLAYYRAVADASPLPVLLYNVPANTGIDMPPDIVLQLSVHPNIVGIKDSSGNMPSLAEVLRQRPPDFAVFAGSASFLLPALALGADGAIVALANVAPQETVALYRAFCAGNMVEARRLQLRLLPLNVAVTSRWGVPALKAALTLLGHAGTYPRSPLLPLGASEYQQLQHILQEADLLESVVYER